MQKYLIKTEHLGLRCITKDDIHYLRELDNDPEVKQYFLDGTLNREEQQDLIDEYIKQGQQDDLPCFVIFELDSERFAGRAYFDRMDDEITVGYLFHKKFWGKGYGSEVLETLLEWARKHIETDYILAYADEDNTASIRTLERCGLEYYKDAICNGEKRIFYRIPNN